MIERFLEEVRAEHQTKVSDAVLQDALREMRAHLEESRDAFLTTGKRSDEAEELAVKAFGDPSFALPARDPLVEWRITRQSFGLMAFLATVTSFLGLSLLSNAMNMFPSVADGQQTLMVTLLFAGIMATPAVLAYRHRKVYATSMAVALFFVALLVNCPTQMGNRGWTLPTQPTYDRLDDFRRAQAELQRAKQVVQVVEAYRLKLMDPGAEPNWEVVNGQQVYPTTLKIAGEGSETKISLSDKAKETYFSGERAARIQSLQRIEQLLPSLKTFASDTSELDAARSRAFGDWSGNVWENSRDYLAGAGIFLLWALSAQVAGALTRRLLDWRQRHNQKMA